MVRTSLIALALSVLPLGAVTVTLTPSVAPPQPVGTTIKFTAAVTDAPGIPFDFQFAVARSGSPFRVAQDYGIADFFNWTPSVREGAYLIAVTARQKGGTATGTAGAGFVITSRVTGTQPVVSRTNHPLVVLFSAPACPAGSTIRVKFGRNPSYKYTNSQLCTSDSSNFFLSGLLPSTSYTANAEVITGGSTVSGPITNFKTGTINPQLPFPTVTPVQGPNQLISTDQNFVLLDYLGTVQPYVPTMLDLQGRIVWYYGPIAAPGQTGGFGIRPVPANNTILLILNDPNQTPSAQQILREVDLATNTVRQTSVASVSRQLQLAGKLGITSFHHDMIRLSNGHTVVIASQEKIFPAGTQGSTEPVDILGDAVIDLDENLQVAWSWSAYDHLDISRPAVLGETCSPGQAGCPPVVLADVANDWLHPNSLNYEAQDGSIIVSLRHQDWLIKIDYANGTGSGAVVWRMGADGDFTITSTDPSPWFSHQHDAEFELGGHTIMSLYDNGNTRVANNPGVTENSRGQVLVVDEPNRNVSLAVNADLGVYSAAVGSAQRLANGNFYFESGFVLPGQTGRSTEVLQSGVPIYVFDYNTLTYRGYRMYTLGSYEAPTQ